jgi:hypothetical protein
MEKRRIIANKRAASGMSRGLAQGRIAVRGNFLGFRGSKGNRANDGAGFFIFQSFRKDSRREIMGIGCWKSVGPRPDEGRDS